MRLSILALVAFGLLISAPRARAQGAQIPAEPESLGLSSTHLGYATQLLNRFVAEQKIAGAVAAVSRRGTLAYFQTIGYSDLQLGIPMTPRSVFRIYSMTKPVTAVAVMMLYEEGRFQLDDPVSSYLPEFASVRVASEGAPPRPPTRPITVRDLLLHTSGLNHRTSAIYREAEVRSRERPLPRFIQDIVAVPLMEDPGTRFRYSEATTVLGRLVEIWSGLPLDEFMQQRIFQPLGMIDTGFVVRPEQLPFLTAVYEPSPQLGLRRIEIEDLPFTEEPALLEGAVGLVSTVPDYLRFAQMLLNGGELDGVRLLKEETAQEMVRNGLPAEVQQARGGAHGWGLANVNVLVDPAAAAYPANLGEYGWDGTAGTIFWVDPVTELVIVLMTQSSPANPDRLRQRFREMISAAVLE